MRLWPALLLGAFACGGSATTHDAAVVDASPPDGEETAECNPIHNNGCQADWKCTYYHDPATQDRTGLPICVPPEGKQAGLSCRLSGWLDLVERGVGTPAMAS